jgi:methyl-accepting chemotaxis protein
MLSGLLMFFISINGLNAQINFDFTDSLVNQQKQYIIRFDVANGNIYLPVKKKMTMKYKELSLFKKDIIKLRDKIFVPLYKDTIMDGKMVKWRYNLQEIENPAFLKKTSKNNNSLVRYLVAGRYFKPSVGSFIRLVFENVPKHTDISVETDFLDKNLEYASTFEGFLNKYATAVDTAVKRDVKSLIQEKKVEDIKKQVEAKTDALKDSIDNFKKTIDTTIDKIESIKATFKGFDLIRNPSFDKIGRTTTYASKIDSIISGLKKINLSDSGDTIIPNLNSFVDSLNNNVKSLVDLNVKGAETTSTLKKQLDSIRDLSNSLDKSKESIFGLLKTVQILEFQQDSIHRSYDSILVALNDSIYNRRTIFIQPIQIPNNDISLLKITYKNGPTPDKNIYREVMLKNRYGFKLDFSTGFIGTGLLDDSYRIVPTPNTIRDTASIVADSKGSFAIGFALMAHAYMRTGGRVNLAINTGLMLNGSNQTLNYLTGISLPLGLEQRFIISGGIAFGKVKRLTSGFETTTPYPSTTLNLSSGVPYTEKWQNSWYLGVSYNLSSLTASSRRTVVAR